MKRSWKNHEKIMEKSWKKSCKNHVKIMEILKNLEKILGKIM